VVTGSAPAFDQETSLRYTRQEFFMLSFSSLNEISPDFTNFLNTQPHLFTSSAHHINTSFPILRGPLLKQARSVQQHRLPPHTARAASSVLCETISSSNCYIYKNNKLPTSQHSSLPHSLHPNIAAVAIEQTCAVKKPSARPSYPSRPQDNKTKKNPRRGFGLRSA
jgi:hypothetical protein